MSEEEEPNELKRLWEEDAKAVGQDGKYTSYFLAVMVVDELVQGGMVTPENFDRAVEIATYEITIQRGIRDFGTF